MPTSANAYFQMACDATSTAVEELPPIMFVENPVVSHQTWIAKATGDVQGIPAATAYDASYVDVSYGFAPDF